MAGEGRIVVVDTYALLADLTGHAPDSAVKTLEEVRLGRAEGILHYLIIYELAYHWKRGRLPFKSEEELKEFVDTYFTLHPLDPTLAMEAARLKLEGDKLLKNSKNPKLNRRRLSVSDATSIALARALGASLLTGDTDLSYAARNLGIKVIW